MNKASQAILGACATLLVAALIYAVWFDVGTRSLELALTVMVSRFMVIAPITYPLIGLAIALAIAAPKEDRTR